MHLFCLRMSIKITLVYKLCSCMCSHSWIAISTSPIVESSPSQAFLQRPKRPVTRCDPSTWYCNLAWQFHWELLGYPPYCLGHQSNTWEVADSTIMRKWKWMVVDGGKCNSPDSTMIGYVNVVCFSVLGDMLKITIHQWNKWMYLTL